MVGPVGETWPHHHGAEPASGARQVLLSRVGARCCTSVSLTIYQRTATGSRRLGSSLGSRTRVLAERGSPSSGIANGPAAPGAAPLWT